MEKTAGCNYFPRVGRRKMIWVIVSQCREMVPLSFRCLESCGGGDKDWADRLGGQFIGENPMLSVISAAVNRPEKNTSSNARVYL
jgi:hypothetical protein